jgi:hypothetical protein
MKNTSKTTWGIVIKIVIAIASAILGVIGGAEATTMLMN